MSEDLPMSEDQAEHTIHSAALSHAALARKYRPQVFAELIGQEPMVRTLRNAFASGRIAQAYMLTGVRGVGKTTTARLVARALNYEGPNGEGATIDITEEGAHCRAILEGRHLDVIEMDAASHTGIDDIRDLIDSAHYKPNSARYKVYIIDEVHMLSKQAFNGLLKTLEEPPEHVKFIFATTEVRKVPVTVLSRCQRFDLRRIDVETLTAHLARIAKAEGSEPDPAALALIARAGEGSVRDALSILDRAIAFGAGRIEAETVRELLGLADRGRIFDLLETVLKGDAGGALSSLSQLDRDGAEPGQVITDLADAVHAVTVAKAAGMGSIDPAAGEAERGRIEDLAKRLSMPVLARAWQMLLKGHDEVRNSPRPLAAADMVLVRLAYVGDLPTPGDVARYAKTGGNAEAARSRGEGAPAADAPASARRDAVPTADTSPPVMEENENPAPQGYRDEPDADPMRDRPMPQTMPQSFEDVVALVEQKRDLKLKNALLEQVRLVHFKLGAITLNPLPSAASDLLQELTRKLQTWTGHRWLVVRVEDEDGAEPLGAQRRAAAAREVEALEDHPAVQEVFRRFPGAKIKEVRAIVPEAPDADDGSDGFGEQDAATNGGTN
ncbi:DNA polymerase III subunit gamma/tau [Methyloceanibacter sp.]|uniref:DNA polymerase III subunit gamma/tau n=1 Tax=Methyloceanibacter sp. TaxID=1965321 RepID=UPI002C923BDF|nr:DNA polymerase III subunit gamma/tau [Methyloceanibacter sp.]HML91278.1 DNA polymerase III subunit gamma/tau [Methyloceanibacter sp.]